MFQSAKLTFLQLAKLCVEKNKWTNLLLKKKERKKNKQQLLRVNSVKMARPLSMIPQAAALSAWTAGVTEEPAMAVRKR